MQDLTSPLGDLDPVERASADELRALQLERLRWSLRHAYTNVSHYRAAFDSAGVHPDDCKDLADLAKFPLTSKADLRDNYPFGMFAVPREQVVRVHASSGTTGRATVVGYTRDDLEVWATVMARSIRAAGGRPGYILHNAYGYGLFTGGLGAHCGGEKLGCTVIPISGGMTERQVALIRDFRPDIIMVTPSYMLAIVDEMERQGDDPAASSLRFGIFGAEPWTNEMRVEMEARLGIDATDIYGLSEVMTREGRMDQLTVHVERRTGTTALDAAEAGAQLSARVKNTIGVTVTTSVLEPDSVERSMGKMRRIVDHRPR